MKEVEKKWRALRTQYTRERQKKKKKSGDGADDVYISKWMYFERLNFLDDYVSARNSRSSFEVSLHV